MPRASLDVEIELVRAICRRSGLGEVEPTLLKAAHHTTLLIQPLDIVARVQSSGKPGHARRIAARELAVARHLARRGAPVVAPLPGLAGPHVSAGAVTTFWPYIAQARCAVDADGALVAETLTTVHRGLRSYRGVLPPYTQALDGCDAVLADNDGAMASLAAADRALLGAELRRLRAQIEATACAFVPLHGDAHPGNLLIGPGGAAWIDWEDVCLGPVEKDIADMPRTAWRAFPGGRPGADQPVRRLEERLRRGLVLGRPGTQPVGARGCNLSPAPRPSTGSPAMRARALA